jgi:hypothetical protein
MKRAWWLPYCLALALLVMLIYIGTSLCSMARGCKGILGLAFALALSGCMSGVTRYTIEPFYDANMRQLVCCRAQVTSGKNVASVVAHIVKNGDNFTVDLTENGVNSSESIQAQVAPVTSVAKAVSDTAETVQQLTKGIP